MAVTVTGTRRNNTLHVNCLSSSVLVSMAPKLNNFYQYKTQYI